MKNEIITIENQTPSELFAPGAIRSVLDRIKEEVRSIVTDPSTEKGRKEIASLAHKVARTKVALDEAGKKLTEDARATIDAVNAERRIIRSELDDLKDEVRRPLTEYEEREKARIERHETRIAELVMESTQMDGKDSSALSALIEKVEKFDPSDMEEFRPRAEKEKEAALYRLTKARDERRAEEIAAAKAEAERIERERIEREEREARIAAEAAERARVEAEKEAKRKAEEEAARVAEEKRLAEEAREAERRAEQERLAAIEREKAEAVRRAKEAEERAERERIEAEERRKREIAEAEERARREAEEKERERLAAIEAERVAEEKRAANKRHREKVMQAAADALVTCGLDSRSAREAVIAIADGKIPSVSIQF